MNLKKKMKGFFTLTRKANGGFTLVELIVVIAILAILAGVAVPAYSGYVTQANKQADITLVKDIEYALTLAGYNGTFADKESGVIYLSADGIFTSEPGADAADERIAIADDSNLAAALKASFGSNYANLKLKYGSWTSNGFADTLDPQYAYAVKNSNYMTGGRKDNLLTDVEKMTSMATKLVTALNSAEGTGVDVTLTGLFGDSALDNVADMYGMEKPDDWDAWSQENPTAFSNMLVLAVANDLSTGNSSTGTGMVLEFSQYYAVAAANPEFSAYLDTQLDNLQSIGGEGKTPGQIAEEGKAWMENLETEAAKYNYTEDNALVDTGAFMSIMQSLNNPTDDQKKSINGDLSNPNLFTEGAINDLYNDYLDLVDAMSGMYESGFAELQLNDGEIAVVYTQNGTYVAVGDTMPG